VTKKATSGPWPVTVVTAGTVTTAAFTWTIVTGGYNAHIHQRAEHPRF
jgi:hypothetical protein